jgi:mono/diheme cytochrome c family protein
MNRILLIGTFLLASGATAVAAQTVDGKPLYEEHCRECHGVRGLPPQATQVKYETIATFNAAFMRKRTLDSLVKILTKGKGRNMRSFKGKLSPDEMLAVAAYVRELAEKSKT